MREAGPTHFGHDLQGLYRILDSTLLLHRRLHCSSQLCAHKCWTLGWNPGCVFGQSYLVCGDTLSTVVGAVQGQGGEMWSPREATDMERSNTPTDIIGPLCESHVPDWESTHAFRRERAANGCQTAANTRGARGNLRQSSCWKP